MGEKILYSAILVILIWVVWHLLLRPEKQAIATELPDALKKAGIWAKERAFRMSSPFSLKGRIDEAFINENGIVIVSDTKSRDRKVIHKSDVLQISAYRVLIEGATGKKVAGKGFVRLLTPAGNEYREIDLLPASKVEEAYELYVSLTEEGNVGRKCASKGLCRGCAYKKPCDEMG